MSNAIDDDLDADLDEIAALLSMLRILLDDHDGPNADACKHLRAWCVPEHGKAVEAMQRVRARLAPPERPTIEHAANGL